VSAAPRAAVVLLLGALLALAAPSLVAANTGPLLDDADATELAQGLAETAAEQGVCYGWAIDVQDDGSGPSGVDAGSSQGPFERLDSDQCTKWIELQGSVHYTSESSESQDSSDVWIESNLDSPPTLEELEAVGAGTRYGSHEGPLSGDDNDVTLFNIMQALPALVAEHGEAEFVPFEESAAPASEQGEPTGKPMPDVLRQRWPLIVFMLALILGGIGWIGYRLLHRHIDTDWTGERQSTSPAEETRTWSS
jgi:hypothetical protein